MCLFPNIHFPQEIVYGQLLLNSIKMYLLGKIILKLAVGDQINGKT